MNDLSPEDRSVADAIAMQREWYATWGEAAQAWADEPTDDPGAQHGKALLRGRLLDTFARFGASPYKPS